MRTVPFTFYRSQIHLLRKVFLLATYKPHNPTGKGLGSKIEIADKDKALVKEISSFNLMIFNKFNGKPDTPEELADRFSQYFQLCIDYGKIPTVEGLAMVSRLCYSLFL